MNFKTIKQRTEAVGLLLRGGFHCGPDDIDVRLGDGTPPKTLLLIGNAGPAMWQAFALARGSSPLTLDAWSEEVIGNLAGECGGKAFYPFAKPYLPFQRWAMKAEPCHVSPLGILIHPDYGLWHGYRGALAFADEIELPLKDNRSSPCLSCEDKPCLTTCPVDAFDTTTGYDVPACSTHLAIHPEGDCFKHGCRARRACPVGTAYIYEPGQAEFHMAAFLGNHKAM